MPHASSTHDIPAHSLAVAATRHLPGSRAVTVGSAPLLSSASVLAVRASDAQPAGTSVPQDARSFRAGGDVPRPGRLEADAYGLNLDFLATCLSCTSAQAGPNSSGAEGRELRLAGESLSEGQVPANGYSNGAVVVVPSNPLLRLAVADWDGYATANHGASRGHARGALLDLGCGDGRLITATAGDSTSDATYSGSASHARSESNAARAGLGGGRLALVVLHSEGSSDKPGHAYLASVNGQELTPAGKANDDNGISVPPLASVALLRSEGSGGVVASASDGRAQRVVGIGTAWVGSPSTDPQPLR
jgi:hypothetical protein